MDNGREIKFTPSRFRNPISKYIIKRGHQCAKCGKCIEVCKFGVHDWVGSFICQPKEHRCIGEECNLCIEKCPQKALSIAINPITEVLGDYRWTADLILSTWYQAETGKVPPGGLEYRIGNSGGGFDKLRFKFPKNAEKNNIKPEDISTSIPLNRRKDNAHRIEIDIPIYGGGMSFGSVSLSTMVGKAKAAKAWNTFTCTGEGGYPEALGPYDDHVITQVATGLFGVREQTIQRVRIIEFKYAQGAKPGLGGHLLGDKNTPDVAAMREAVAGSALFSPFPFHSVYSVEDHKKHVDWIKAMNPKALVSIKVSTPTDVDMVAVGSYYADAHIIHLDGSYGGTGAAPNIAKKNIAMPIEYAIPKVHKFLVAEGVRDEVTLIASGGIRTAHDVAKAIALGADGVVIGTAELVALECVRCANCESGRGCVRGIATTDRELSSMFDANWAAQRLINLLASWHSQLVDILKKFGMKSIRELVGRTDCLIHLDYVEN
jgi:glutamate synthase domain-containing protein 2/NAD-dependent dihydropyrimidine dehydrogenase PreA subunit